MEISDNESSSSLCDSPNRPSNSSTPYTDAVNCRKKADHVKRPMNSFMVWSQIERRKIEIEHPSMHNAEISKQLGLRWKELNSDQRRPFIEESERLRQLHEQEFPHYKYQPKKRLKGDLKNKNVSPLEASPDSILNQQRKLLPKIISSAFNLNAKKSSTMSDANLERMLLTGKNLPKQTDTRPTQTKNTDKPLSGFAAMAKKLQSKDTSSSDQSDNSKTSLNKDSNSQPLNSFSFSLFEKKFGDKNAQSTDDIDKFTAQEEPFTDKKQNFIIDKKFRENLKGTKITPLDTVVQNIPSSPVKSTTENLNALSKNKKIQGKKPRKKLRLHIDGSLTSGSICTIANRSKHNDSCETFDYLTDMVIRNSKHPEAEIKIISKQYEILRKSNNSSLDNDLDFPEGNIPSLSELLGENWSESDQKFEMP